MRRRVAAVATAALALVAATLTWAAPVPAFADTPGFAVSVGQPGTFTIGQAAKSLTAVVSTEKARRCQKVRWSLAVQTEGISLDQLKVTRVEDGRAFPVRAELGENGAGIVDTGLDPGQLCRNRTVSAQWNISFAGPDDGRVSFEVKATDTAGRLLATGGASTQVVTAVAAQPSATPSASASASPSASFTPEPTEAIVAPAVAESRSAQAAASLARANSSTSILFPGLIVGAVLVLLGILLLVRLRKRNGKPGWHEETQILPTGFYNLPSRHQKP